MIKKILCIILHFGNEDLTWNCVKSLIQYDFLDIIISDNDITQSINLINDYKEKVTIFRTGGTDGFAQANNRTVTSCRKKEHFAVLLLNNDTIAADGSILLLKKALDNKKVGAVGPCMPYLQQPEIVWACGGYINKLTVTLGGVQEKGNGTPFDVDYLPGAAILCKLTCWDKVGGLPEKYFLAYEEAEFALRIKKLGFRIIVDPKSIIYHKVGMSSDPKPKYRYNSIRNRMKFASFIWGKPIGSAYVITLSFLVTILKRRNISLWMNAVWDELRNLPLDRDSLITAENKFKKY